MAPSRGDHKTAGDALVVKITDLDKSSEPLDSLVSRALGILGWTLPPELPAESLDLAIEDPASSTPQVLSAALLPEWMLKWILGRLARAAKTSDGRDLRCVIAWRFMLSIVQRVSIKVCARLLVEFKFIKILAEALHSIRDVVKHLWLDRSSSGFHAGQPNPGSSNNASAAFMCCQIINTLFVYLQDRCRAPVAAMDVFAQGALKHSLRLPAHLAARALGDGVSIVFCAKLDGKSSFIFDAELCLECTSTMWTTRIEDTGDAKANGTDHNAFVTSALGPIVQMLSVMSRDLPAIKVVERLLQHQILLDRDRATSGSANSTNDADSAAHVFFRKWYVDELREAEAEWATVFRQPDLDSTDVFASAKSTGPLTVFFASALRAGRQKSKQAKAINDDNWSSQLFVELSRIAGVQLDGQHISAVGKQGTGVLDQLLEVCIKQQQNLRKVILCSIVMNYCELSQASVTVAGWNRLALCLKLEPSLVSDAFPRASATSSTVLHTIRSAMQNSTTLREMSIGLLVGEPLMEAFLHMRDLNTFVRIFTDDIATAIDDSHVGKKNTAAARIRKSPLEDQEFLARLAERWHASLDAAQLSKLLGQSVKTLRSLLEEERDATGKIWAQIVLSYCCMVSIVRRDDLGDFEQQVKDWQALRIDALVPQLLPDEVLVYCFKINGFIAGFWPQLALVIDQQQVQARIAAALQRKQPSEDMPARHEIALAGWNYSLACAGRPTQAIDAQTSSSILSTLVTAIKDEGSALQASWKGINATTRGDFLLAMSSSAILSLDKESMPWNDEILTAFWKAIFEAAARHVHAHDSGKGPDTSDTVVTWMSLWRMLLDQARHSSSVTFLGSFRTFCGNNFCNEQKSLRNCPRIENFASDLHLALEPLAIIDLGSLTASDRSNVANSLLEALTREYLPATDVLLALRATLDCTERSKSSTIVLDDPKAIWRLCESLDRYPAPDARSLISKVSELATAILRNATKDVSSSTAQAFASISSSAAHERLSNLQAQTDWASLELLCTFMSHPSNASLRRELHGKLQDQIRKAVPKLARDNGASTVFLLEIIRRHPMLLDPEQLSKGTKTESEKAKAITSHLRALRENFEGIAASRDSYKDQTSAEVDVQQRCIITIDQILEPGATTHDSRALFRIDKLCQLSTMDDVSAEVGRMMQHFRDSSTDFKVACLQHLRGGDIPLKHERVRYVLLLRILGDGLGSNCDDAKMKAVLEELATNLITVVANGGNDLGLAALASCVILRHQPRSVRQWHIEQILTAVIRLTSVSAECKGNVAPTEIFDSLVQLLATIFANHRHRIRGRFHLISLALQGLLHCLILPFAQGASHGQELRQANWLLEAHAQGLELQPRQASSWGRLVTMLCDPSPSFARRAHRHPNSQPHASLHGASARMPLHDDVAAARAEAGLHLQHVLVAFCTLQLRGRFPPAIRPALNPALYSICDAMGPEIRRVAESTADDQVRAILRTVYEDWTRFGKWTGA